jgi:hypothetical protein
MTGKRKAIRKHLVAFEQKWNVTLGELLQMEDDVYKVTGHPTLKRITQDPGRMHSRIINPDEDRIYCIGKVQEIVDVYTNLPARSKDLVRFCAFLERYALRLMPEQYITLFKGLGITSIRIACGVLHHGLKSSVYHKDSVGLLLVQDPHFKWDRYSAAVLSRTMSRQAFYAAIPWERFCQPDFLAGLNYGRLASFMRETLKPDALEDTQDSRVALLRHFATTVPKVRAALEKFSESRRKKLWSRICDNAFTQFQYRVVKDIGVDPWKFFWPDEGIAKLDVARWRYQDEVAGKPWIGTNNNQTKQESEE